MVWASIIAATCVSLILLQKILWLVVPALLALILYYFLFGTMQWLMLRGLSRDAAATVVILCFLLLMALYLALLLPWALTHLLDWQTSIQRYLQGGIGLAKTTLQGMERSSAILRDMNLSTEFDARVEGMTSSMAHHIEPVVIGAIGWAPSILLAPFLAYFFLKDGGRFQRMLGQAVPNAFFERTLYLLHEVDRTARAYFQGLFWLTILDTLTLGFGLWWMGFPGALALGFACAVLAWLPFVGSVLGGLLVVLVAATDFPNVPGMAYGAVVLFGIARLLDDFVYMPLTVGRSLHVHPMLSVLMMFVGGAIAGVAGLMLVLPLLGVIRVVGDTIGQIVTDARLMARFRHRRSLQRRLANVDLQG
ncbi:MAG: AI-2E family transporter [Proteobacteria bacterium]|nr:AI-2E family transporter [Pseudomonadota bacterium]